MLLRCPDNVYMGTLNIYTTILLIQIKNFSPVLIIMSSNKGNNDLPIRPLSEDERQNALEAASIAATAALRNVQTADQTCEAPPEGNEAPSPPPMPPVGEPFPSWMLNSGDWYDRWRAEFFARRAEKLDRLRERREANLPQRADLSQSEREQHVSRLPDREARRFRVEAVQGVQISSVWTTETATVVLATVAEEEGDETVRSTLLRIRSSVMKNPDALDCEYIHDLLESIDYRSRPQASK